MTGKKPAAKVLGATTAALQCSEYITEYLKPGEANDEAQVRRLKIFLNVFEKENLTVDGVFDERTRASVERFQVKHEEQILSPWGIGFPTGFVYYTTRKVINEMYCNSIEEKEFPLTESQQHEILAYRNVYGFGGGLATEDKENPQAIVQEVTSTPLPKILLKDLLTPIVQKKHPAPNFYGLFEWGTNLLSVIPAQAAVQ